MQLPAASAITAKLGITQLATGMQEDEALWFYILKEAQSEEAFGGNAERLGVLGSVLVAATFAGLLKGDPLSFFNVQPGWTPEEDPLLESLNRRLDLNQDEKEADNVSWGLPSIIRLSGLPVDGAPFSPAPVAVAGNAQ
jgi:hypothetical protein